MKILRGAFLGRLLAASPWVRAGWLLYMAAKWLGGRSERKDALPPGDADRWVDPRFERERAERARAGERAAIARRAASVR